MCDLRNIIDQTVVLFIPIYLASYTYMYHSILYVVLVNLLSNFDIQGDSKTSAKSKWLYLSEF